MKELEFFLASFTRFLPRTKITIASKANAKYFSGFVTVKFENVLIPLLSGIDPC